MQCSKCEADNYNGTINCENCNTVLRPRFLGIMTVAGIAGGIMFFLQGIMEIGKNPFGLLTCVYYLSAIIVLIALRNGKFFGWVGIQVLWGINILFLWFITLMSPNYHMYNQMLTLASITTIFIVIFWAYIRKKSVKEFCDV